MNRLISSCKALVCLILTTSLPLGAQLVSVTNLPANRFFGNGMSGSYGIAATGAASDSGLWISSNWSSSADWLHHLYNVDTNGVPSDSMCPRDSFPGNYLLESYGLGHDGQHFWYIKRRSTGGNGTSMVFKINRDGTIADSIPLSWGYVGGVCWADSGLWFCRYYPNNMAGIFKIDVSTGQIVDSIPTYGTQPIGVARNSQYYYYVMDDNDGNDERIHAYDPVLGDTVYSIALPERSGGVSPRGMVWDGNYLWLIARPVVGNTYALYQYDLSLTGTPQITTNYTSYNFQHTKIGQPETFDLQVSSTGTADLIVDSIAHSNPAFSYSWVVPDTIAFGQSVMVPVTFDPNMYGLQIDTLKIYSNDPNKPVARVALQGFGIWTSQEIDPSAASHDFGPVLVQNGTESVNTWDLDITNQGAGELVVSNIVFTNPDFYLFEPVSFPLHVDSVSTTRIRIAFEPSQVGAYLDTMTIFSNDSSEAELPVTLQGSGVDSTYDFGGVFWTFMTPDNPFTSGDDFSVEAIRAISDVTGDGYDDVIIGTENYYVQCLNGNATGVTDTIWSFNSGLDDNNTGSLGTQGDDAQKALQVVSDLNDDGYPDVVAGFGGGNEGVYVLSGRTGAVIWSFDDPINYALGDINAVYAVEDFNGDSIPDVLATASATDPSAAYGRRKVYCFDGVTGDSIWVYFTGAYTRGVVSIGDVNGNGKPDVVATTGDFRNSVIGLDGQAGTFMWEFPVGGGIYGAKELVPYPVPDSTSDVIAAGSTQYIYRLDGATGAMRWQYNVGSVVFPNQLILLDDVNGNGYKDIIAPLTGSTAIMCIDGQTGTAIWNNALPMQTFGAVRIPDVNADGINDAVYASHDNKVYIIDGTNGQIIDDSFSFGTGGNNDAAESLHLINDLDGNASFEIIAGCRNGQVAAISGGDMLTAVARKAVPSGLPILRANYPNPFNPATTVRFVLPVRASVRLDVFNTLGQRVRSLARGTFEAGEHNVTWNGKDDAERTAASGVYFYRIEVREAHRVRTETRKLLLVK